MVVVAAVVVVLFGARPSTGSALETGGPPWPPETGHLRGRLEADGLAVLTAEGEVLHTHQHLDLYVDGQPVEIPPDIGINQQAGYLAPIHTHDATGTIHVESPTARDFTLGEFFDVWGVRFDAHCVGGICDGNGRTLSIFVDGQPFAGDPRSVVLAEHQEIVVAIGPVQQLPSPIPSSYAFPAGLEADGVGPAGPFRVLDPPLGEPVGG